jgi:uncharacterized protein
MIIDVHGHLGNINQAPFWAADAERLESICDTAGVDLLCVSSAKALMYDAREGNADMAAALKDSRKLRGYVVVNPMFPETAGDLALLRSDSKFCGVKVHPDYHGYDVASPSASRFLDRVAEEASLMLFHVSCMPGIGFAAADAVARFARRHPKTNFILAHMAGIYQNGSYPYYPNLRGCEEVAAMKLDNVYFDTAHYLMYVYPGVMRKMVDIAGASHIVFGTDVPLQGPMQVRFAMETIMSLDIPSSDKEAMLGGNAKHLLELR